MNYHVIIDNMVVHVIYGYIYFACTPSMSSYRPEEAKPAPLTYVSTVLVKEVGPKRSRQVDSPSEAADGADIW